MEHKFISDFKKFGRDTGLNGLVFDDYARTMNSYIEPHIVETNPSQSMISISVFSRLFMERILFIGSEINSDVANIINSQLLYLDADNNKKPINIYINSGGGSVPDGLSIYDLFNFVSAPIHTTCMGTAASMAAVLLSSGEKGNRLALPNSRVMIHQPLSGIRMVQQTDFEIYNDELRKCKDTLTRILAENTGQDYEVITAACDRDNWFGAQEAIDFGLIDSIATKDRK